MLSADSCELKTSPLAAGNLVVHIYNPEETWIAVDRDITPNGKLIWRSNEVGLVLRVDVWGDSPGVDILISVMIPTGIGYCFGSDVNMI
jgi:hypothetical protein